MYLVRNGKKIKIKTQPKQNNTLLENKVRRIVRQMLKEEDSDIVTAFLKKRPNAKVTEKKKSNGDVIVYVNGQTAFNKEDIHNSSNWLTMLEKAYQRSQTLKEESTEYYSIAVIVDKKYSKIVTSILEKMLGWDGFNEVDRMDYIHYELTQSDFDKVKPKIEKYIEETEEV